MDLITGLPPIYLRNGDKVDSILVIVNKFTKIIHYFTINKIITSQELAMLFYNEIKCRRGIGALESIVSNKGSIFTSQF